jgi:hypothetical protein
MMHVHTLLATHLEMPPASPLFQGRSVLRKVLKRQVKVTSKALLICEQLVRMVRVQPAGPVAAGLATKPTTCAMCR